MTEEGAPEILTESQKAGFTEAFNILDKQQQGYIPFAEFNLLFRSIGQNPTEAEVQSIIQEYDTAGTQHFGLDKFISICESDHMKDPVQEDMLLEAFRTYDKDGKGTISVPQLRYMMQCMGEPLGDEEADDFVSFADKENLGEVNYEQLVKDLIERDPGLLACM